MSSMLLPYFQSVMNILWLKSMHSILNMLVNRSLEIVLYCPMSWHQVNVIVRDSSLWKKRRRSIVFKYTLHTVHTVQWDMYSYPKPQDLAFFMECLTVGPCCLCYLCPFIFYIMYHPYALGPSSSAWNICYFQTQDIISKHKISSSPDCCLVQYISLK